MRSKTTIRRGGRAIVAYCALVLLYRVVLAQDGEIPVSGRVVDFYGEPIAGALVQAHRPGLGWISVRARATTQADGTFTLAVPNPDVYLLTFGKARSPWVSTYNTFYYPDGWTRNQVIVEPRKSSPLLLKMPATFGSVTLNVRDAVTEQRGAIAARMKLCRLNAPQYCYTADVGVDPVPVIPDPFIMYVTAEGYEDWHYIFSEGLPKETSRDVPVLLIPVGRSPVSEGDRLPSPVPLSPADGAELADPRRITKIQWSPVPGAASYTVDIEFCEGSKPREQGCVAPFPSRSAIPLQFPNWTPTAGLKGTSYEFNFIGAQPGRWRVWAIDRKGRPGHRSKWQLFYYMY